MQALQLTLFTSKKIICREKNPKQLKNARKALSEGAKYVENNKKETAKLAFEQLKLPEKTH
ncbi:hypothetical protein ACT7DH_05385 [Bacillus pacificus]